MTDRTNKTKNFTVTSKINIPDIVDGKLLDVEITNNINKEQITDSRVMYEGEMNVNFIFSNSNGNVNSKVSKIPFEFSIENPIQDENVNVETKLYITNKKFDVKPNGDIDCNIDVEVISEFSQNISMNIIDDIEAQEFTRNIDDYDSLIIYIVQKGDTLWNIAKKFRSTVEDISRVNGIENPDQIQVGQKLYIPKFKNIRKGNIDAISA